MKNALLAFCVLLVTAIPLVAQPFEGKITYKNTYTSKLATVTDDQLESMMGNVQQYYIKDGNFKSMANGRFVQWQLYINRENRLYNKLAGTDTILWINASLPGDSIISSQVKKEAETILGYVCDELTLTGKNGVQKYYYNSRIAADPSVFSKFTFGNWYDFLREAKALPLKIILDTPQFTLERIALDIKPETLDAALFTLPIDAYTMESSE